MRWWRQFGVSASVGGLFVLAGALGTRAVWAAPAAGATVPQSPAGDARTVVSRADLRYVGRVAHSEQGMPIGNGRTGSLVWATPRSLRLQVNRVDVFPSNSASNSFYERHQDFTGGCGFVDLDFGTVGAEVFPDAGVAQHLSIYDGRLTITGKGVSISALTWPEQDVLVVRVVDERPQPVALSARLRMLRSMAVYARAAGSRAGSTERVNVYRTRSHTSTSRLQARGDRIVLTQEFAEGDYRAGSALAIGLAGPSAGFLFPNETELQLLVPPGQREATFFISSAAASGQQPDPAAAALAQVDAAAAQGHAALERATEEWWHGFWSRGYLALHSADGVADYVEQNYNYYLYIMAATSRGKYPAKFNGMIWSTAGDLRPWGSQFWGANQSCYNEAVPATDHLELLDPTFSMYSGMYAACALAARQQWGSQGIYIPETAFFDGLAKLPDDVAAEMRELYLMRKPWDQRSERFKTFCDTKLGHSSRYNWKGADSWVDGRYVWADRGAGPFGPVSHIFATGAKLAYLYWQRYEYTLDRAWLKDRAYPMIKGVAEFYRNFPNLQKGADGKYHILHVNSNEPVWDARDTDEEIAAMRGIFPAAIKSAEILNADPELQRAWREVLANLAPLPTSDGAGAGAPAGSSRPRVWVKGIGPAGHGNPSGLPDQNTLAIWLFDLCTLENPDAETLKLANATYEAFFRNGVGPNARVGVLSKVAIAAATLGRAEDVKYLIPAQIRASTRDVTDTATVEFPPVLANRMTLREGPQAMDVQRLGRAGLATQLALLQSLPPGPAQDPIIRLFPSWPREWDAAYTLRARGAFLVSAEIRQGVIGLVRLRSEAGSECRLRNPWGAGGVRLRRNGKDAERLQGALLRFKTTKGELIEVTRGR